MFSSYQDLVEKYGQRVIDEVSQTEVYNETLDEYVLVKDRQAMQERAERAIEEAYIELRYTLSCCINLKKLDELLAEGEEFLILKHFERDLAYNILKEGSDCPECNKCKDKLLDFCRCQDICSTSGVCIGKKVLFDVEEKPDCLPEYCFACGSSGDCCCE